MTDEKRVCVGQIGRAHGVRGQVRIKPFTEDPLAIADYGALTEKTGRRTFEIVDLRPAKDVVVATLKGVSRRDQAEALNGVQLFVRRDQLPPEDDDETFYYADLIGLNARQLDGTPFGLIKAVHDFGAGDLLEIALEGGGQTQFIPFTRDAVPTIDVEGGFVIVDPPEDIAGDEPDT